MKDPLDVPLRAMAPAAAEHRLISARFAECLQRQRALGGGDDERVHGFRLACKRLRFALERLDPQPPALAPAQHLLAALTDELGWAHDCSELASYADRHAAQRVARRARRDRDRYVLRARRLWRHGFLDFGEFEPLARYAGLTWSIS